MLLLVLFFLESTLRARRKKSEALTKQNKTNNSSPSCPASLANLSRRTYTYQTFFKSLFIQKVGSSVGFVLRFCFHPGGLNQVDASITQQPLPTKPHCRRRIKITCLSKKMSIFSPKTSHVRPHLLSYIVSSLLHR